MFYPELRGQAIFTVPTRALANDKLSEWRKRGWDVGIATGDVAMRLDARVVVATLETQKGRLLKRKGPALLVIDEYQMIADEARGVNYEIAIALAPPGTQLLLLSGSVANPGDVARWLERIGRAPLLVSHAERPVPLQEVDLRRIPDRVGATVREYWPRAIANAIREDLGPVLLFAPRRNAAEELARQIASALPADRPLVLDAEQRGLAGTRLAKLLASRVAFHHSGLSYAQRALLVEPLAKAGELRCVVATMGLAAGINFSMRSVAIAGSTYMAGHFEKQVQPDELLQMFGRAGRRGLDEAGCALVTERSPRLQDALPRQLRRSRQIDWPTLLAVMRGAVDAGLEPFTAAMDVNERLYTLQKIPLGIEHALATGPKPCGLSIDMERARFARKGAVEILNRLGMWEPKPPEVSQATLGEAWIVAPNGKRADAGPQWVPALSRPEVLKGIGLGNPCRLPSGDRGIRYGREIVAGTRRKDGQLALSPALKRLLGRAVVPPDALEAEIVGRIPGMMGGRLESLFPRGDQLVMRVGYDSAPTTAWIDSGGNPLIDPPERRELPMACKGCEEMEWCLGAEMVQSPAHAWRTLGLISKDGAPTRRGIVFSYFQRGEGLAVAAALEDDEYPIEEMIFDIANLRAGPRFAGDDSPHAGRLANVCQRTYQRADVEGYLEMGVPPDYGAGAAEAVRALEEGQPRQKLLTESVRMGDLERAAIEWRSLLRHIALAPDFPWERWQQLQKEARRRIEPQ